MKPQNGITVTFRPGDRRAVVKQGTSLLEAARKAGVVLPTRCGGKSACLMCKVTVGADYAGAVRPPEEAERRKLGSLLEQGIRLGCQTAVWDDLSVTVPEDPLKAAVRRRLEAARRGEMDELW
ncbi:2Fe-2S iron-sulfur cluster-binding protein [Paenibacillus sp. FSL R7-0331]|uniref:2Fe-2S iron-sulfur cluster-binding protein n=1 Tax=Paenibacillus sp. FSL R7-0331 TaxID=1536773 RepID=UPI0004F8FD8A|nr:2Fe-2S iron-sulfur cluster-binding protein [Paenibacillus sp. FSL R7-0331]AIQ53665.1 ferredoxin [Paenibacillus sp. FSL R7-0331]